MQEEEEDRMHDPSMSKDQERDADTRSGTAQVSTMQVLGQITRGKGGRKPVISTKSFNHAVKASSSKKVSSKRK